MADEVRQLTERASAATREIGALIVGIQASVDEAVVSMQGSACEVENGVERAGRAGESLNSILQAAESVSQRVSASAAVAEQISASSNDLVAAMDWVSAVV